MDTLEGLVLDASAGSTSKPPVYKFGVLTSSGYYKMTIPMGISSFHIVCEQTNGSYNGELGPAHFVHDQIKPFKPHNLQIETIPYLNGERKVVRVDTLPGQRSKILGKITRRFYRDLFRSSIRRRDKYPLANKWLYPIKGANTPFIEQYMTDPPFTIGSYISFTGKMDNSDIHVDDLSLVKLIKKRPNLRTLFLDSEQANPRGIPHPAYDPTLVVTYASDNGIGIIESDQSWEKITIDNKPFVMGWGEDKIYKETSNLINDHDVVVIHNTRYDIPFWYNRSCFLGRKPVFGRSRPILKQGGTGEFLWFDLKKEILKEVKNRYPSFEDKITLDTLDSMGKIFSPSGKQKHMQAMTIGTPKADIGATFGEFYLDPQRRNIALDYALGDAVNLMNAANHFGVIDAAFNLADFAGLPVEVAMKYSFDSLMRTIHRTSKMRRGNSLPFDTDIESEHLEKAIEDLLPKMSQPGIYSDVRRRTTKSLISDLIVKYNIDPEKFNCGSYGCRCGGRTTPHGSFTFCNNDMGEVPLMIQQLRNMGNSPFEREVFSSISDESYKLLIPIPATGAVLKLAMEELPVMLENMDAIFAGNNSVIIPDIGGESGDSFTAIIGKKMDGKNAATLLRNGVIYPIGHKMEDSRWPKFFVDSKLRIAESIFRDLSYRNSDRIYNSALERIENWKVPESEIAFFTRIRKHPDKYTWDNDIKELVDKYDLKQGDELDYFFDVEDGPVSIEDLVEPDITKYKRRFRNIVSPLLEVPVEIVQSTLTDF